MGNILNSSLVGELYKFGLNSEDWLIEKDQSQNNQYLLVHRCDPDFQMRGSVEYRSQESGHWTEITIHSL